ncbi:hypothetical protein FOZ62_024446 [Perkinsus olseni]|uniref:RING-type domain-containing protein n=1 Tax=Perkinsus olseni TaxID=32597 RepID=A0A7J6TJT4_PEROL|nr:hypothetical protein FOZ62_024446 [Perkinsus olseni]
MTLAALMSRRFMVVWVAWVVLAVAYTVWIFESPDSQGASSPLMIVLMCILIAVPIVALFVGSRMVKKLFPPPPPRGTYRRDSVIDLEDGRGRFPTMDSVMESATSQSFFKAWDYWVQDNTTTATIDDISHDDGADGHRDEEPCAICLSEYQVGEVSRRLPCGSKFNMTPSSTSMDESPNATPLSRPSDDPDRRHHHHRRRVIREAFRSGVCAPKFRAMWIGWLIMYISLAVFIGLSGEGWPILVAYLLAFGVLPPIAIVKRVSNIQKREAALRDQACRDRAEELAHDKLTTEKWLKDNCETMMGNDPRCICYCKDECAICLSDYHPSDVLILLPCHHIYHLQCIKMLLDAPMSYEDSCPRCPLCRARLGEVLLPEKCVAGDAVASPPTSSNSVQQV